MPVGTRGTVRTQTLDQLERARRTDPAREHVSPDAAARRREVFEQFGGLHRWMGWNGAILTDSGGFQIFSLARVDDRGRRRAPQSARRHDAALTPERSIAMQRAIGSDIMMVLDQCIDSTSPHADRARRDGAHASLGASLARRARRLAAGAVRDRPGRVLRGAAARECRRADVDRRLRRLRDRRPRRRRDRRRSARTSPS